VKKSADRIAAEREMAIGLPLIAKHNPKGYAKLMRLLARLVAQSRRMAAKGGRS